jgi:[ribosomal protein S5]-alanine N-acetyltransferase
MEELNLSPFPTLKTSSLILRQLNSDDAGPIFTYQSNKDNFPYVDMPLYTDIAEAKAYIEKMNAGVKDNKWIIWAITDNNSEEILGTISIWNISFESETADLGYGLFSGSRGRGIMSEAIKMVVEYGFNKMGLIKLEACTNSLNHKSIALLERNGFSYSSTFEEPSSDGEITNMEVYCITTK